MDPPEPKSTLKSYLKTKNSDVNTLGSNKFNKQVNQRNCRLFEQTISRNLTHSDSFEKANNKLDGEALQKCLENERDGKTFKFVDPTDNSLQSLMHSRSVSPVLRRETSQCSQNETFCKPKHILSMPLRKTKNGSIVQSTLEDNSTDKKTGELDSLKIFGLPSVKPVILDQGEKSNETTLVQSSGILDLCSSIRNSLPSFGPLNRISHSSNHSGDIIGSSARSNQTTLKGIGDVYDNQVAKNAHPRRRQYASLVVTRKPHTPLQLRDENMGKSVPRATDVKEKRHGFPYEGKIRPTSRIFHFLASEEALLRARQRVKERQKARTQELRIRRQLRQRLVEARRRELSEAEKARTKEINERHILMHLNSTECTKRKDDHTNFENLLQYNPNQCSEAAISRLAFINTHPTGFGSKLPRFVCLSSREVREFNLENSNSAHEEWRQYSSKNRFSTIFDLKTNDPNVLPVSEKKISRIPKLDQHYFTQTQGKINLNQTFEEKKRTQLKTYHKEVDTRMHHIFEQCNANNCQGTKRNKSMDRRPSEYQLADGIHLYTLGPPDWMRERKFRVRKYKSIQSTRTKSWKNTISTADNLKHCSQLKHNGKRLRISQRSSIRKHKSVSGNIKALKRVRRSRSCHFQRRSVSELVRLPSNCIRKCLSTQNKENIILGNEAEPLRCISAISRTDTNINDDTYNESTHLPFTITAEENTAMLNCGLEMENVFEKHKQIGLRKYSDEPTISSYTNMDIKSSAEWVVKVESPSSSSPAKSSQYNTPTQSDIIKVEMDYQKNQLTPLTSPRRQRFNSESYHEQREARKRRLECIMSRVKPKLQNAAHKEIAINYEDRVKQSLASVGDGYDNDLTTTITHPQCSSYVDGSKIPIANQQDVLDGSSFMIKPDDSIQSQEQIQMDLNPNWLMPPVINPGNTSPIRATIVANMLASGVLDANSRAAAILLNPSSQNRPSSLANEIT